MSTGSNIPQEMEREYLSIQRFVKEYNKINYLQLDSYTTQKVNLFALPEQEQFSLLEFTLDKIISALPALKRILSKPITRLKDVESVLPVEAVRVINNSTMSHIAIHTELWGNVDRGGLKPRKLKTLSHEEEYKIYENVATVRLVNAILALVRKNVRLLRDIMYSCQPMNFNLLERTNHLMYFLAIGKLHVGYQHAQNKYNNAHLRCLEKLIFIDKSLRSKLNTPVYKICKKDKSKLTLKKTNVFRLQKDYIQVYNLLKLFTADEQEVKDVALEALPEKAYADYCVLLSIFSAGHFNFEFNEKDKLDFANLNVSAKFKGWSLTLKGVGDQNLSGLNICVKKDKSYSFCLIFFSNEKRGETELRQFKGNFPSDEYFIVEPSEFGQTDKIYLNLFDINSFRRIQQLIYKAMVYSDTERKTCAFCGSEMIKTANGAECSLCKSVITDCVCSETNEPYITTSLKDYKVAVKRRQGELDLFVDKDTESALFFRNITPINRRGKPVCPHCGKVH